MDVDSTPAFALSAILAGHEQDVRAVGATGTGAVLTASRDHTMRVWQPQEAGGFECSTTLAGHTHYVIAACSTAVGAASGSNDKHIIEWDLQNGAPLRILEGHTNTVSCVVFSAVSNLLYSASWDKTAKVWKDGACLHTLEGHQAALWAVLPVEDAEGRVLTASADKTYAPRTPSARVGGADAARCHGRAPPSHLSGTRGAPPPHTHALTHTRSRTHVALTLSRSCRLGDCACVRCDRRAGGADVLWQGEALAGRRVRAHLRRS